MAIRLKNRVLHGGNIPGFINLYGTAPAQVCKLAGNKRRLNIVTVGTFTGQAIVARHYLAMQQDLSNHGIEVHSISSLRNCAQQKAACDGICGHGCAGCPGLCAPCGTSAHQTGAASDQSFKYDHHRFKDLHAAMTRYYAIAKDNNFFCFDEFGGDPMHLSFAEAH
jgi:hypothetical protein